MKTTILKYVLLEQSPLLLSVYEAALKEVSLHNPDILFQGTIVREINNLSLEDLRKNIFQLAIVNFDFPFLGGQRWIAPIDFLMDVRRQGNKSHIMVTLQNATVYKLRMLYKKVNPNCIVEGMDCTPQTLLKALTHLLGNELYYSPTILFLFQLMIKANDSLDDLDYLMLHELSIGTPIKKLPDKVFLSPTSIYKRRQRLKEFFKISGKADNELIQTAKSLHYI